MYFFFLFSFPNQAVAKQYYNVLTEIGKKITNVQELVERYEQHYTTIHVSMRSMRVL